MKVKWTLLLDDACGQVDKKVDKQADINNRMAGMGPLPPIGRATYSRAIEYVQEAYDILLGENWKAPEE